MSKQTWDEEFDELLDEAMGTLNLDFTGTLNMDSSFDSSRNKEEFPSSGGEAQKLRTVRDNSSSSSSNPSKPAFVKQYTDTSLSFPDNEHFKGVGENLIFGGLGAQRPRCPLPAQKTLPPLPSQKTLPPLPSHRLPPVSHSPPPPPQRPNGDALHISGETSDQHRPPIDSSSSQPEYSRSYNYDPDSLENYAYDTLLEGTQNFSYKLIIGQGGFGKVYKGMMPYKDTWCEVAVKVMLVEEGMDQADSFHNEVILLGGLKHPNLVRLLGYCLEKKILVYEYLEHGSLEDALISNAPKLAWRQRVRVLLEAAIALQYLHSMQPDPVMHRDFKPANILLDINLRVRLADVGLAKMAPELAFTGTGAVSYIQDTTIMGTLGYIDPMYLSSGKFRPASDVYALGVTILQLVTGHDNPRGLIDYIDAAVESNALPQVIDTKAGGWPLHVAVPLVSLGMECLERRPKDRPNLRMVVLPKLKQLLESDDVNTL
mmetsp:Transcript_15738/g.26546  ORF Transcript_15738/g.26546 Transcript_15738/m.26546 type:complete len:485 (+) Transcript_15738:255-1709(+)|eukprot:CAMPEP_0198221738 /NCGR_PEP_ID=MMETSP1445-20131203/85084_1 /TAXON_ID=36898 /ORGANISM="Pyramimonas sp., Strain CCMP2087" /LENGTH=484 /DNA_ID=CAMNT_0043899997 /DNA_START=236 /DNA_END=1690 /DNA_ORIENTATION=+